MQIAFDFQRLSLTVNTISDYLKNERQGTVDTTSTFQFLTAWVAVQFKELTVELTEYH